MLVKARFVNGPLDGLEKSMKKPLEVLLWLPVEVPIESIKTFTHKASRYELVFHDEASAVYRWKPA